MLIYIFGIMDLISAVLLILFRFDIYTSNITNLAWIFGLYLIIKGVIFIKSLTSLIDIASGALLILAIFGTVNILTWLAALWLLQKGVFTFL
ncbi:hypothetical protein HYX15_01110 [Candidatus Woesearchaeota archaeon]|nr:hypothetical protein [Candidatus Woesearchaeota archaeon]